ncbi:MAG: hypothetical protein ACREQY_07645, partial [Candidatus Binatia bacterium]
MSALIGARSGLTISNNYQTGMQALLAAEAGAVHAQHQIDQLGVIRFDTEVVDPWGALFGSAARSVPGHPDVRYSVTVEDDGADARRFMILTSTGQAPNEAQRSVRVRVRKNNAFSPGAIYLPNPNVTATFRGTNFLIDGQDYPTAGGGVV